MAKQRYTAGEVVEALEQSHGLITHAAALLGCSRGTVLNYVQRYPTVAETLEWKRREIVDLAMAALIDAVEAGAPWAILFTLRTFGADRGYGADPQPVSVQPVQPVRFLIETAQADGSSTLEEIGGMAPMRAINPPPAQGPGVINIDHRPTRARA